jgi:hypothetical protein
VARQSKQLQLPLLIKIGQHYIDPNDVAGIKHAKDKLYIIMLKSSPEPQYPMWIKERDFEIAKQYFKIEGEQP